MKKSLKKISLIALVFVFSLSVFMGCHAKSHPPVSIELWYYYSGKLGDQFSGLVSEFNDTVGQKEKIVIEPRGEGAIKELNKKLIASANNEPGADKMPTMFMAYGDMALGINSKVPLANLDDYFTDSELGEYVSTYIDEGRIDSGKLKVFPIAKATETIILDIDRWNEFSSAYNASNPTTPVSLDDFATDEGILVASEKYYNFSDGKALFTRDATDNYFLTSSMQLGEELYSLDSTGKMVINFKESTARTLWNNYYVPYVKGYYSHNGRFGTDCIQSKETMSSLGSTSASANYPAVNLKVLPAPIVNSSAKKIFTQQGAGLCVTKTDAITEKACATFLKWFTDVSRNIRFSINTGYLPVKKLANDYETIKATSGESVDAETLETIKVAIEMINSCESMYARKPAISGGDEIQKAFKIDFVNLCKADALEVGELLKTDKVKYDEAIKIKTSDEYFKAWYNKTRDELLKIGK